MSLGSKDMNKVFRLNKKMSKIKPSGVSDLSKSYHNEKIADFCVNVSGQQGQEQGLSPISRNFCQKSERHKICI